MSAFLQNAIKIRSNLKIRPINLLDVNLIIEICFSWITHMLARPEEYNR
ncbi:33871_t:CDS:2 [Gigaspora margarita]|uniref:33871_t:CDS:1 n=1 Tax=Gigaspora margarita TaxID=4874 RepID=A0ABN7UGK8_GIGMA|nr:33871_t:CDS:2 [Gigaspora margarita]